MCSLLAEYAVGRTTLVYVKLRDKCKIEKTLFSNFRFFLKIEKIQVLLDLSGRKREQNFGTNGLKYFSFILMLRIMIQSSLVVVYFRL